MGKVIVINGSGGVGKSTFVQMCKVLDNRVMELSVVDLVKIVAGYAGWNGAKDDKGRRFLSDIKDAMDRYGDLAMRDTIERIKYDPDGIVFVNARDPKDIERLVNEFNATTLLITRDSVAPVTTNHADAGVSVYDYDYVFCNNGSLPELFGYAEIFMKEIQDERTA